MDEKFSVTLILKVDREANFLSSVQEAHPEDVYDLIKDMFYDIDDVKVENLVVKERV
tara:strand:- start:373 stop:543 length:171 start_codon:yes stop_codon:yes gene_type:complete